MEVFYFYFQSATLSQPVHSNFISYAISEKEMEIEALAFLSPHISSVL